MNTATPLNTIKRAEKFLQSQGAVFTIEQNPTLVVPASYGRQISSCYTGHEIEQILDSVEQAVRLALNPPAAEQMPAEGQSATGQSASTQSVSGQPVSGTQESSGGEPTPSDFNPHLPR